MSFRQERWACVQDEDDHASKTKTITLIILVADAIAVLNRACTPADGLRLRLSMLERLLQSGGRQPRVTARATEIHTALRAPQLEAVPAVTNAYGIAVRTLVHIVGELHTQITALELTSAFERHTDAEMVASLPGLGPVLGARALAEFGDDPARLQRCQSTQGLRWDTPITRASGTRHTVLARWRATAIWSTPASAGRTRR